MLHCATAAQTSYRPATTKLDRALGRKLEAFSEVFGSFPFERVDLVDGTVNYEAPAIEQAVASLQ